VAGLAASVLGGAAGPPGHARPAVGVTGGDDQAPEQGDVLEEVQLLLVRWALSSISQNR
jgi:hypothetical protein